MPISLTHAGVGRLEYNRDVRPILAENCFACHGPDSAARKAGLRLDQRDAAIKANAWIPGKAADSMGVKRILSADPDECMPPPTTHKKLTAVQKDVLRKWIEQGAEYQPHWSFIPPVKTPLPNVKNASWIRNPIDAFVLARLEAEGLTPAPEADRRTLARRASLDLVGLPPSPTDVEAFVNDKSPNAYEKYVDRLLASPHWGEHRGRYWLDAARYADTHGLHFDNYREMYSYRDWVIAAFNRNQPFDRFTTEQLAGDLLPKPTLDQLVASGFNRCNVTTNEGGTIEEENAVFYTRDRTETTAQVWLGLTAGCAVCHEHKFDPLSQKEFYQLSAFFNNTTQRALDDNIKDTPPVVIVPSMADRPRWDAIAKDRTAIASAMERRKQSARADFTKWLASAKPADVASVPAPGFLTLHAPLSEPSGDSSICAVNGEIRQLPVPKGWQRVPGHVAETAFQRRGTETFAWPEVGDFEKDKPFSVAAWVQVPPRAVDSAIIGRMDEAEGYRGWDLWVNQGRVAVHMVHRWSDDAMKSMTTTSLPAYQWTHVVATYDGSGKAAGLKFYFNGVEQPTYVEVDQLKSTIRTKVPLKVGQRSAKHRLERLSIQDLRVYGGALSQRDASSLAGSTRSSFLLTKGAKRSGAETDDLFAWWLSGRDSEYRSLGDRRAALDRERAVLEGRGTKAHVMNERQQTPVAYVLFRGEYDKRRDKVGPDTPKAFPPMAKDAPRNRLGLAKWLLAADNPLTTRVTVNRFWQEVFGTGLVRTSGDFGIAGELPSHPELLDWLAIDFRENGWEVKRFFKQIVLSSTYRQSAATTPEKAEKDAQNRLLSRGPRFRMDAEMIRDYALAAGGLLVEKIGGRSVKPYQPDGVWEAVAMMESNTRYYQRDRGEDLYRRSLYTFWKRAAPPASLDALNAPSREFCCVRRERTNTPLQALVTLNDPQFVEAARALAAKVMKEGGATDDASLDFLAKRVLSRPFRNDELPVVRATLAELLKHYRSSPSDVRALLEVGEYRVDPKLDAPALAGWTMLANEVLNLDEALTK